MKWKWNLVFLGIALGASIPVIAQSYRNYRDEETRYSFHKTAQTKTIVVEGKVYSVYYSDGIFIYKEEKSNGNRWNFADISGRVIARDVQIVKNFMDFVPVFYDGVAITHPSSYQLIDKTGQPIKSLEDYFEVGDEFVDGVVLAKRACKDNRGFFELCYLGTDGKVKYPALTQRVDRWTMINDLKAAPLRDKRRRHFDYSKNRFGYLDASGNMVIAPQYLKAKDFSEGLAAVKVETPDGEKWGFIDTKGAFVIGPKFMEEPGDFHDGWAVVTKTSRKQTYCGKDGTIMPIEESNCLDFIGGLALCGSSAVYNVINTKGEVVSRVLTPSIYELHNIREENPPLILHYSTLFTPDMHPLLSRYGSFTYLGDGLFWFKSSHVDVTSCVVRANGEIVMLFELSEF